MALLSNYWAFMTIFSFPYFLLLSRLKGTTKRKEKAEKIRISLQCSVSPRNRTHLTNPAGERHNRMPQFPNAYWLAPCGHALLPKFPINFGYAARKLKPMCPYIISEDLGKINIKHELYNTL